MDIHSSNDLRTRTQTIISKLSDGCVVSGRASNSTHISYVEGKVGVVSWLAGYPGACMSLHLPSTERVSLLTSSVFYPDLSSPVPVLLLERW